MFTNKPKKVVLIVDGKLSEFVSDNAEPAMHFMQLRIISNG
jgi:hypothetical protein